MNERQQRNSRQYRRIADVCLEYLDSGRSIASTISDLEGLIQSLEGIPSELRNQFLARSGVLEDLYAASIDRPEADVLNVYRDKLITAVVEIRDAALKRAATGE